MTLPRQNSAWVDGDGRPTRDLYNWARQITVQPQTGSAQAYALGDLTNVSLSGISDGDVLTWSNTQGKWVNSAASSSGYAEGTAFPSSPTTGDKFYRTDLNWLCFYDGTRWLTCTEYSEPIALASKIFISSIPDASGHIAVRRDFQPYITTMTNSIRVSTTSNGSNFWTINLLRYNSSSATSTVHTFNTSTLTAGVYTNMKQTINSPLDSSAFFLAVEFARTGSPGLLGIFSSLQYRLIVT